jgi:predicted anti-sigma-YlaC factor YlaD
MNMHHAMEDGLEDFLAGCADREALVRIEAHLRECAECRREVKLMKEMSEMFASLRSPDPPVPAPGFYIRVSNLIEKQQSSSFWTAFMEPVFGKRLALASLLLLATLGTVLMSRETEEYVGPSPETILAVEKDAPPMQSDPWLDRDQMLFTLASHSQ